jgi:hypothetical protein
MKNELQESNASLKQENLQLMEDNAVVKVCSPSIHDGRRQISFF